MPRLKASMKTVRSGRTRNSAKKRIAAAISTARVAYGSAVTAPRTGADARETASDMAESPPAPYLEEVDPQQAQERDRQHDGRDHPRDAIIEFRQHDDDP